jgi:hypothetical protein
MTTAVIGTLGAAGLAHASETGDNTGNDGTRYGGSAGPLSGTDPAESQYNFGVGPNAGSDPHGVAPIDFGDGKFVHMISPNQDHADSSYGDKYKYDPDATYDGETWDYNGDDNGGEGE